MSGKGADLEFEFGWLGWVAGFGREDIGYLAPGMCADFFAIDLNQLDYAGGLHDPVSAVVFCNSLKADYTVVGGELVVEAGELLPVDLGQLIEDQNKAAQRRALSDPGWHVCGYASMNGRKGNRKIWGPPSYQDRCSHRFHDK